LKKCLGQDSPKRTCPLSVVRGQKQPEKATWEPIMYCGTCQVQPIVPILLPVWKILAHPTTPASPESFGSTLLGAMACAWHVPYSNGFQALQNAHACGFCTQRACGFWTMVRSSRSQKSLSIVPCKGTIKRQKKATWKPLSTMMPLVLGGIGLASQPLAPFT
jgi:hypothetical protein